MRRFLIMLTVLLSTVAAYVLILAPFGGRVPNPPAAGGGGGGGGVLLTSFDVKNIGGSTLGSGGNFAAFLGFEKTAVPTGSTVEIRRSDDTTVVDNYQLDNVALYDDGSLRCCAVRFYDSQSITAAASKTFKAYSKSGSANNSSSLTTSDVKTGHDFQVVAVIGGTTYEMHVNDYIDNATNTRVIGQGPNSKEWRISAPLKDGGGTGTSHAQMWARAYVRVHSSLSSIRVFFEVINGYPANTSAVSVTSLTFKDGSTTIWSNGAYTHASQAIQACVDADGLPYWSANEPTFFVSYDREYMAKVKLLWRLDHSAGLISAIGTAPADNYGIMDPGGLTDAQNTTGASLWIGPIPFWDACAYITQDSGWAKFARTQGFGSFASPAHFYQSANFNPIVLNGHTYSGMTGSTTISWNVLATITITGQSANYEYDTTHYPHWCYYQYITTGDHWFLDEVQAHPVSALGQLNPANDTYARNPNGIGSGGSSNYVGLGYQVSYAARGDAWYTNILGDAAWVTPDSDPAKTYFTDLLSNQFTALEAYLLWQQANHAGLSTLGWMNFEDVGTTKQRPWMHDYMGIIWAKEYDRGTLPGSNKLWADHEVKNTLGRMVSGCINRSFPYGMGAENGTTENYSSIATAWSQVFVDLDGDDVLNTQFTPGCPGSGVDANQPYSGGHSYPAIGHAHVWVLEHLGVSGASTVRTYLDGIEDANQANWASNPQWKIRP